MRRSLFGRLLVTLLASVLVLWIVAIGVAVHRVDGEVGDIHDRQLAQTAQVLLALAGHEIAEHLAEGSAPRALPVQVSPLAELGGHLEQYAPEDGLAFHVAVGGAGFHFRSASFPASLDPVNPTLGYTDTVADGTPWRLFMNRDETGAVLVQVAQPAGERERLALGLIRQLVPPLLVGLAVTVLVTVFQVRRARRPLAELATALDSRESDCLEPLQVDCPTLEIAPITTALNHLVGELRDRIERERRFVADAAHELRTPLASIQTDAAVAQELDGEPQREALLGLRSGANRAARLVGQLMTLARLDPLTSVADGTPFELGACAESIMAQLAPAAHEKRVELSLEERSPGRIRGQQALVDVLIRNLVENAIRYTPAGGQVQVVIEDLTGATVLKIHDSGPGIPADSRERVFERFYRGMNGAVPGSGLGLSISARIAALHDAEIELGDSPLGGLCALVRFPPSDGREQSELG